MYPSFREFRNFCIDKVACGNKDLLVSLNNYSVRFYHSFLYVAKLTQGKRGLKLLSLGGGGAFVEAQLCEFLGYSCTILDLPCVIEKYKEHYSRLGFSTISCDISTIDILQGDFDIIVSFENIEHLPEAPSKYFAKFTPALNRGGTFIISTPNLGRIGAICKLLCMKPLLAEPESTFAQVSQENAGLHRREYMPSEIVASMNKVGLTNSGVVFTRANTCFASKKAFINFMCSFISRFKPHMIISGRKPE